MDCTDATKLLHGAPDDGDAVLRAHLEQCAPCRALKRDLQTMRAVMPEIDPDPLPVSFELDLRRELNAVAEERAQGTQREPRTASRWMGWAIAAAAAVLLAIGASWWIRRAAQPPGVTYHRVHLVVRTATPHPRALFDLQLPANVELVPEAGALLRHGNELRWRSALQPGINEIELPLVSRRTDTAAIRARLTVGGRSFTATVNLHPHATPAANRDESEPLKLAWVLPRAQRPEVRR